MRPRRHRQDPVVWKSPARPVGRNGAPRYTRLARRRRIRRWPWIGVQLAVIGLMHFARAVRTRRGARLWLAGSALMVTGMSLPSGLPSGVTLIAGILVVLRGVAVTLGVSELHRRFDGAPSAGADYFGLGSLPSSEPHDCRTRVLTGRS